MIDVGDTITLTYPSKPASPSTVTVTIGLPDGTVDGPHSATSGSYSYPTVQVGRHTVLWVSTGPSDAYSDMFEVLSGDAGGIISLDDAKAHLRVTQSSNDEELRLFITSTTALIEHEVGAVVPKTHSQIVNSAETIVLDWSPVVALTSVVPTFIPDGGLNFGIPSYVLDGPPGILRQQPFSFSPWGFDYGPVPQMAPWQPRGLRLTVTYVAGRNPIPPALQLAARIILEGLWESRRLAGPKPASGDEEMPYGREVIPSRAVELMAPYRRAPLVA